MHLKRIKRIYRCLCGCEYGAIRFSTEDPGIADMHEDHRDWEDSARGDVEEVFHTKVPGPLGKYVVSISNHDANLWHNIVAGRSVTGVLNFFKKNSCRMVIEKARQCLK